jgi:hypothetical protein
MKSPRRLALVVSMLAAAGAASAFTLHARAETELATQRKVQGVITAVDSTTLTIATEKATITGKLDPSRTRVTKNGKPAKAGDLQVTSHAKAELCLDEVWTLIATH